jgi:molybdopterin/thiamine biosynthesis adenylyltransferase
METDALREGRVAIFGLGSGGSFIARELVKAGVGNLLLADHDRLEAGNFSRHECGLADLGRLKVNAVKDSLLQHNPALNLTALPIKLDGSSLAHFMEAVREFDPVVLIGATDTRESRLLLNRLGSLGGWVTIFAGVFRRAYGGQVLRVVPGLTACYQCFVSGLPAVAADQEVSSTPAEVAYADRPVAVEPGLSSDILPIALHVVKLAILELIAGRPTTLSSLRDDLVAPLYLWFNRREEGTDTARFDPMRDGVDRLSVLRWYGTLIERDKDCPACGSVPLP